MDMELIPPNLKSEKVEFEKCTTAQDASLSYQPKVCYTTVRFPSPGLKLETPILFPGCSVETLSQPHGSGGRVRKVQLPIIETVERLGAQEDAFEILRCQEFWSRRWADGNVIQRPLGLHSGIPFSMGMRKAPSL